MTAQTERKLTYTELSQFKEKTQIRANTQYRSRAQPYVVHTHQRYTLISPLDGAGRPTPLVPLIHHLDSTAKEYGSSAS